MVTTEQRRFLLVYQAGLANVFEVDSWNLASGQRNSRRLLQADFRACENFAWGIATLGHLVATVGCNQAGDIINAQYTEDLDDLPFSDRFHPVFQRRPMDSPSVRRYIGA